MAFAEDVRAGLSARPKTLPSRWFYDALGSALFEAITRLPEYYLTRAESELLARFAPDVIEKVGGPLELVELGSGSAIKTRYLIAAALQKQPLLSYRPIDISSSALEESAKSLEQAYPNLAVEGFAADYFEGLKKIPRNGVARRLVLFLGSNIGNFEPAEAGKILRAVRSVLERGDALLMGTDL